MQTCQLFRICVNFGCFIHSCAMLPIAHHHTYNNIDGIDYQILVEADFLVNMCEDELSEEALQNAYQNIFRTETGKKICREMYDIE